MMRSKEEAADYRYFPDPDLPPVKIGRDWVDAVRRALPELPAAKRERFVTQYGLSDYDAKVLAADRTMADFFEAAARSARPKPVANWIVNELARVLNERKLQPQQWRIVPAQLVALLALVDAGTITAAAAKEILPDVVAAGRDPADLVRERGLAVVTDAASIEAVVDRVLAAQPKAVADYRGGKVATLKFLVGQVMKETRGTVKAPQAEEILKRKLAAP
jgi:aspartyl-tRNA(Asn)/glutamyl-tRNA(Gln) amidotransferase subunit B